MENLVMESKKPSGTSTGVTKGRARAVELGLDGGPHDKKILEADRVIWRGGPVG